jgi:hypothetical protein
MAVNARVQTLTKTVQTGARLTEEGLYLEQERPDAAYVPYRSEPPLAGQCFRRISLGIYCSFQTGHSQDFERTLCLRSIKSQTCKDHSNMMSKLNFKVEEEASGKKSITGMLKKYVFPHLATVHHDATR